MFIPNALLTKLRVVCVGGYRWQKVRQVNRQTGNSQTGDGWQSDRLFVLTGCCFSCFSCFTCRTNEEWCSGFWLASKLWCHTFACETYKTYNETSSCSASWMCVCMCVCSGTHRCWRCLRAGAGRILVSSCGTGTRRYSADSPVHLCCGRIHTAASHHVRHTEMHAGYTYTCRKDTQNNPSCCSCVTVLTLSESTMEPTIKLFIESCQYCCSILLFLFIFGRFFMA